MVWGKPVGHRSYAIRTVSGIALCALLSATPAAASLAAGPASGHHGHLGINARVIGTFEMVAHVTVATNVRGEYVGQVLHRVWQITPEHCRGSVCQSLRLYRQRSAGRHNHLTLRRVATGHYVGQGVFYVRLRCNGHVYRHGSRAPYTITLTVRKVTRIEGIAFARRVSATYVNAARTDATPCPLGPSHDAGRYVGRTTVPTPPVASFTSVLNALRDTASFSDRSDPGRGGAAIVGVKWNFGDRASGVANSSTLRDPSHHFRSPGIYAVSLTVLDSNGLSSTASRDMTAPGPPHAAFTDAEQGTSATFNFTSDSTAGIGKAPIVAWTWNFGDPGSGSANSSTLEDPSHTFSAPGGYTVKLTVLDANGYTATTTQTVSYRGSNSSVSSTAASSDSSRSARPRPGWTTT